MKTVKDSLPSLVKRKRRQRQGWERGREEKGVPRESEGEQAVLAGPWLRARPQLFMRQCTCQEPTDKHNSKAERKSNSASMGNAHNAPGGTHLGPFLCCFQINREQGYLSTAWFSSRAKSCWNHLCLSGVLPPLPLFTCSFFCRDPCASGFHLFKAHYLSFIHFSYHAFRILLHRCLYLLVPNMSALSTVVVCLLNCWRLTDGSRLLFSSCLSLSTTVSPCSFFFCLRVSPKSAPSPHPDFF